MSTTPLRRTRVLLVVLLLLGLIGATTRNAEAADPGDGRFHVDGTTIIGPNGQPFVPRGLNKGGLEWRSDGYDMSWWTFWRMHDWGANFVRVPVSSHFALPSMCTYDSRYLSRIDQVVAWAESLQMMVLLSDHWSTQGRTCGGPGWANQQKMADTQSLEFVRLLAERYKDHPYVAIDLYNEPHDISDAVWRNGGTVDGWTAVGMQQLLDAVRSTGNTNLVFASGNSWANDLRMVVDQPLANDANVVYAFHSYPFSCSGQPVLPTMPYRCQGKTTPPFLDTWVAPAIARRAVMATEFGTTHLFASEMQAAIDWFEAHGVGWSSWLFCYGTPGNYCLARADYSGEPTIIGQPVRDALRAHRN